MLNIPVNTRHVDAIFTSNPLGLERRKHSDSRELRHNSYRKSDTPCFNKRLKIPTVGYVVSYLQASKERGRKMRHRAELCLSNQLLGREHRYENKRKSFVFIAALLRDGPIFMLRGAPKEHEVC